MIRRAVLADKLRVLGMAKVFHAGSQVPFPFSAPMAEAVFLSMVDDPCSFCLVYEVNGTAHGVLMAQARAHSFAPVKMAFELIFWIDPAYRGRGALLMLNSYEAWACEQGCAFANMVGLGCDPATSGLYERRGYQPVECHFMKPL
jgi:GNAT superfamily N-acetyltransferase